MATIGRRTVLAGIAALGGAAACGWARPPRASASVGLVHERRVVDGRARTWSRLVPPSGGAGGPLVLAIHGHGATAVTMARRFGLAQTFDALGWVGVFPDTLDEADAPGGGADFLGYLIARVGEEERVDPRRIYVVGFSNGGKKAYWLAAQRPDIAAIAVHSGWIGSPGEEASWVPTDRSSRPSILHLHGGRDEVIRLDGGVGRLGVAPVPFREGLERWATHLGARRVDGDLPREVPARLGVTRWSAHDADVVGLVDPELAHRWADGYANALIAGFLAELANP